ncbi:hypothetical protein PM082_016950 [Marasmius tenuissimus]|nr:hypothetical protein PM082_016950 [Marasmius tenuissimus]
MNELIHSKTVIEEPIRYTIRRRTDSNTYLGGQLCGDKVQSRPGFAHAKTSIGTRDILMEKKHIKCSP